uniref:Putative NADH dehydrogenase n=1 Tax=viral metagenome TaxID=1070528 RepID=A0A6M3LBA5_9ZZZZ
MKAFVTGATGFIGSHLVDEIIRRGGKVVILDMNPVGVDGHRADYVIDLNGKPQTLYEEIFKKERPDVIFNLAASKCTVCAENVYRDWNVNAVAPMLLARAAFKCGIMDFIHVSTGSVYGTADDVDEFRPRSYYGVSKLAGEKYLGALKSYFHGFRPKVLRYFHVYGPRQNDSLKGGVLAIWLRERLQNGSIEIHGDGQQVRHFTHVDDVVNLTLYALDQGQMEQDIFNTSRWKLSEVRSLIEDLTPDNSWTVTNGPARHGDCKTTRADKDISRTPMMPLHLGSSAYKVDLRTGLQRWIDVLTQASSVSHGGLAQRVA